MKGKSRNIIKNKRIAIVKRAAKASSNLKRGLVEKGSVKDLRKSIESI
ncbi:MAG: hypothetical protein LLG40_07435 [Deltaproteobacteria bacterium]|nr:hypothetical protein [Deltaproteobacteria bacterium]